MPYDQIAALFRKRPSVPPGSRVEMTGTPGHMASPMSSAAATLASVRRTASIDSPGRIRQLTVARARCGDALSACPASTLVAIIQGIDDGSLRVSCS
jgi:hypothetical protein